ncbi:hypothetical protein ACFL2Q_07660 [Thermodesulfobacteriota bacterium]
MRRFVLSFTVTAIICVFLASASVAQDFPAQPRQAPSVQQVNPRSAQQKPVRFYGYVPPPPLRHTWPGGYRVIMHELMQTMAEHILGQY